MLESSSKNKLKTTSENNLHGLSNLPKENTLNEPPCIFLLHWDKQNHFTAKDIDSTQILYLPRKCENKLKYCFRSWHSQGLKRNIHNISTLVYCWTKEKHEWLVGRLLLIQDECFAYTLESLFLKVLTLWKRPFMLALPVQNWLML